MLKYNLKQFSFFALTCNSGHKTCNLFYIFNSIICDVDIHLKAKEWIIIPNFCRGVGVSPIGGEPNISAAKCTK